MCHNSPVSGMSECSLRGTVPSVEVACGTIRWYDVAFIAHSVAGRRYTRPRMLPRDATLANLHFA